MRIFYINNINYNLKIKKIPITRNEVFEKIFESIIFGYFKPGMQLVERELSKAIGVSRTPIREAFRELERMDLVTSIPYKGVIVNKINNKKAKEICLVRMHLEQLAIDLCIKNINEKEIRLLSKNLSNYKTALNKKNLKKMLLYDDEFHSIIYKSTKNDILKGVLKNLRAIIGQCRLITLPNLDDKTFEEHSKIYEAIKNKDIAAAQRFTQEHIESFYNILEEDI